MLADQTAPEGSPLETLAAVADAAELIAAVHACRTVHVAPSLHDYVVALCGATRADARLALGASPRAGVTLVRLARAHALVRGRDHVLPDDVKELAPDALAHRLLPAAGRAGGRRARSSTSCSRGCPCRCERRARRCADRARARRARLRSRRARLRAALRHRRAGAARRRARRPPSLHRARLGRPRRRAARRACAACRRSPTRASACASRSSCARSRAHAAGRAAFREAGVGGGVRAAARLGRRAARAARQLRARPAASAGCASSGAGELVREDPFGLARRADATRGSTALTVLAPPLELAGRRARGRRRGRASRGSGCAAAGTSCTACASTSRASRCAACTGPRPRTTAA